MSACQCKVTKYILEIICLGTHHWLQALFGPPLYPLQSDLLDLAPLGPGHCQTGKTLDDRYHFKKNNSAHISLY